MTFTIPESKSSLGEYSLNKIYQGRHWAKRKQDADYWHYRVLSELRRQNIPRRFFQKAVHINFWFNSRLDSDNHGYIVKLIIDGFKGYLISDDNKRHVKSHTVDFWDGDGVKIEIKEVTL